MFNDPNAKYNKPPYSIKIESKKQLEDIIYRESNFEEYVHKSSGYICRILRPYTDSHLCGYVAVRKGHPMFGKNYDDIPVRVHWGLTYSSHMNEDDKNTWWLGFDCAHAGDLYPPNVIRYNQIYRGEDCELYRTKEFVRKECNSLARQLKRLDK